LLFVSQPCGERDPEAFIAHLMFISRPFSAGSTTSSTGSVQTCTGARAQGSNGDQWTTTPRKIAFPT
jgi:hypothetical protein